MKFIYQYRTPNNKQHKAFITAPTKEAAYAILKAQGIKPGRVDEAPGFFNKLFGKGKRWLAIAILAIIASVSTYFAITLSDTSRIASADQFDAPVRRQLIGDAAVIEKGIRTGWADVFELEGDRFLASYAIPGFKPGVTSTTIEELDRALGARESAFIPAPSESVRRTIEFRQIIAIVSGMKREINALRKSGWTLKEVGAALVKRQEREISFYRLAEQEVSARKKHGTPHAELLALWEEKNNELRNLGIKLVPMPE